MTTLQKSLIAAIVILGGIGIYEARHAAFLRNQVDILRQAQAPLTAQIRQLQSERDDTTNRLASMREENEHLNQQLGRSKPELLRLRGEVSLARKELTEMQESMRQSATREQEARAAADGLHDLDERLLAHLNTTVKSEDKVTQLIKEMNVPEEIVSAAYDAKSWDPPVTNEYREFFKTVRDAENQKIFFWILVRRIEQEKEKATQEAAK